MGRCSLVGKGYVGLGAIGRTNKPQPSPDLDALVYWQAKAVDGGEIADLTPLSSKEALTLRHRLSGFGSDDLRAF